MDAFIKNIQNLEDLKFGVFSFNLGDQTKQLLDTIKTEGGLQNIFNEKHKEELKQLFDKNQNKIWIISTQEDTNESIFLKYIEKEFTTIHDNDNQYYKVSHNKSGLNEYYVHLVIYAPLYLKKYIKIIYNHTIWLGSGKKYLARSKSSVITSFSIDISNLSNQTLQANHKLQANQTLQTNQKMQNLETNVQTVNTDNYINIVAVGSHLSMEGKKDQVQMGLEQRIADLENTLNYINEHKDNTKNTVLIWTGDLNFRLTTEYDLTTDQLLNYIQSQSQSSNNNDNDNKIILEDLTNIDNFGPTCKTRSESTIKHQCTQLYKKPLRTIKNTQNTLPPNNNTPPPQNNANTSTNNTRTRKERMLNYLRGLKTRLTSRYQKR